MQLHCLPILYQICHFCFAQFILDYILLTNCNSPPNNVDHTTIFVCHGHILYFVCQGVSIDSVSFSTKLPLVSGDHLHSKCIYPVPVPLYSLRGDLPVLSAPSLRPSWAPLSFEVLLRWEACCKMSASCSLSVVCFEVFAHPKVKQHATLATTLMVGLGCRDIYCTSAAWCLSSIIVTSRIIPTWISTTNLLICNWQR